MSEESSRQEHDTCNCNRCVIIRRHLDDAFDVMGVDSTDRDARIFCHPSCSKMWTAQVQEKCPNSSKPRPQLTRLCKCKECIKVTKRILGQVELYKLAEADCCEGSGTFTLRDWYNNPWIYNGDVRGPIVTAGSVRRMILRSPFSLFDATCVAVNAPDMNDKEDSKVVQDAVNSILKHLPQALDTRWPGIRAVACGFSSDTLYRANEWSHTVQQMYKTGVIQRKLAPTYAIVVATNVRDANVALDDAPAATAADKSSPMKKAIETVSGEAWGEHHPHVQVLNDPACDGLVGGSAVNIIESIRTIKSWKDGGKKEWERILEVAGQAGRAEQARVKALAEQCGSPLTAHGLR